jgi:hypothetical protein
MQPCFYLACLESTNCLGYEDFDLCVEIGYLDTKLDAELKLCIYELFFCAFGFKVAGSLICLNKFFSQKSI